MAMKDFGGSRKGINVRELSDRIVDRRIQEYQEKNKESYCIHTKDPRDELSDVVRELLKERPLICRRR